MIPAAEGFRLEPIDSEAAHASDRQIGGRPEVAIEEATLATSEPADPTDPGDAADLSTP